MMTPQQPYDQWSADDVRAALTQAAAGEEAWARDLIAAGADPNGMPLIMAIQCGELAIVEHGSLRATSEYWATIRPILLDAGARE